MVKHKNKIGEINKSHTLTHPQQSTHSRKPKQTVTFYAMYVLVNKIVKSDVTSSLVKYVFSNDVLILFFK